MSGFEGADNNNWEAISTFLGRTVCLWKETTEGLLSSIRFFKPQGETLYDDAPIHIYATDFHAEYLEVKGRDRVAINKRNYDVSSSEFSRLCKEGFYIETHPYKLWYESNKTWFFLQAYVLSMAAKKALNGK